MMKWVATLALAASATAVHAQVQTVDYARSEVSFAGKQMGVPTEGRFKKYTAQIAFDPKQLARAKVEVDRKSTRLNSSHSSISYAVFCLKKKKKNIKSLY